MHIVFVTSEMSPYAKSGGLADVCGSLPDALSQLGHTVTVFMPYYKVVREQGLDCRLRIRALGVPCGDSIYTVRVFSHVDTKGVEILFIDAPEFFDRDHLYGMPDQDYEDNAERFAVFQRGVLEALKAIELKPDIMHCHDWQTGLIPVYLKTHYRQDTWFRHTRTVFTIHNLAYQGLFDPAILPVVDLPKNVFTIDTLEFYGKVCFMKGGLVFADAVTTVSQRYAREIMTREYGCGLDGVLRARTQPVDGILNGIDLAAWDPEHDTDLTIPFRPNEWNKKLANKGILQKECGFEVDPHIPVLGMTTRLVDQKGLDILIPIMPQLNQMNVQVVILGMGDLRYNEYLGDFARKHSTKFATFLAFDRRLSKRIYAGCDIFMMPSHFEPCGLGQMIALRYGAVPLVRETGGLADTITNFDSVTGQGNGFSFKHYSSAELSSAIRRALSLFRDTKVWRRIVENGMRADFSWKNSAEHYTTVYQRIRS